MRFLHCFRKREDVQLTYVWPRTYDTRGERIWCRSNARSGSRLWRRKNEYTIEWTIEYV